MPVIAIGVPTVVGAAAIVHDTVGALVAALKEGGEAGYGDMVEHMDGRDQYQLIREVLEPQIGPMYVTPNNIDELVENLSFTISEAIHMALCGDVYKRQLETRERVLEEQAAAERGEESLVIKGQVEEIGETDYGLSLIHI